MAKTVLNDRYELAEEVGKGGMAVTYRARDTLLNRTVAVKVMRETLSADPDFVERFRREAQAAASLSHPNIASVYDTGADRGRHYIVMEFIEGENLEQRLRREGPLDPAAALDIALQVVAALEAAHRRGIVHRDVKPHNVLLTAEGRVKVTDFGIAKAMSATADTDTGLIVGSVHYFSPEQARGDPVGPQSDLYSLGVVLFEALTGRRPFEGSNPVAVAHKQIYDPPPLPSEYRRDLPPELENIILKCLEKSLARRYASAAELRTYLEDARERLVAGRYREGRIAAPQKRMRGLAWTGAGLVIAAMAVTLYFLVAGQRQGELVVVPDVSGLDAVSAQRVLRESGLEYRAAPERLYSNAEAGLVARQNPRALARVQPGAAVTVWFSRGPKYATVPEVARMSRRQAETRLREAGLEPGEIVEQYDDQVPAGYVVGSDPKARQQVERGTQVALIISKGQPPAVWEPPPGGETGAAEATIAYVVPDDVGPQQVQVRIEAVDERGTRVLYDAPHMAGDQLPPLKVRYATQVTVRALINGKERWSQTFGAESPAPAQE